MGVLSRPPPTDKERYKWFEAWCQGEPPSAIAKRYNRHAWQICRYIKQFLNLDYLPTARR